MLKDIFAVIGLLFTGGVVVSLLAWTLVIGGVDAEVSEVRQRGLEAMPESEKSETR